MFLGHALLAAGIAAVVARAVGVSRERALSLAAIAGLFGAAPDVDILYALPGLANADALMGAPDAFWTASTDVHRGVTHSLILAVPAAVAVAYSRQWPSVGTVLAIGMLGVTVAVGGLMPALILAAFLLVGTGVAVVAHRVGVEPRVTFGLALVGFLTHPFGDLLTGTPPPLLFPLDITVLATRIQPFADPTLNLLLAFGVELAVLWFGVWALARTAEVELRPALDRRAVIGGTVALAAFVLTPPTMAASAHFVLPALAVGLVGALPRGLPPAERVSPLTAVVTGLAAITVGVLTYTVTYLLI